MDAAILGSAKFRAFYDDWSKQEADLLRDTRSFLKNVSNSGEPPPQSTCKELVEKMMGYIQLYHDVKMEIAAEDATYIAAGLWRTPLEAGFIWLGGWRPSAAIMLAYSLMGLQMENELQSLLDGVDVPSMAALSHHQLTELNNLQQNIRKSEAELSDRLAHSQMMVADEEVTKAAVKDPPVSETEDLKELASAMNSKLEILRDLLIDADKLRLQTLRTMIDSLTPLQAAQYLVTAVELSISVRKLGAQQMLEKSNGHAMDPNKADGHADLHSGAANGETKVLSELLKSGADPTETDYDGRTPMHLAASNGHTDVIELLIREGADVNAPGTGVADSRGTTPLLDALKGGHDRTAQVLIDHGAVASEQELGGELCKAAATGNMEYLRKLVQSAKCDPNTRDYDHRTPLHLAAAEGNDQAVDILLQAGGDPYATDRHGFTPVDEAKGANHQLVLDLLQQHHARPGRSEQIRGGGDSHKQSENLGGHKRQQPESEGAEEGHKRGGKD